MLAILLCSCSILKTTVLLFSFSILDTTVTETTSLQDYGKIIGNNWPSIDKEAQEDFLRIFPRTLEPYFEDIQYYYHAEQGGFVAVFYEIMLEFTISSPEDFERYLGTLPSQQEFHPCPYLPSYLEYMPEKNYLDLADVLSEDREEGEGTEYFRIDCANIQKILIDPEAQHVVIACLRISDDGGTKTTSVYFFTHFHIDPQEVEQIENNNSLWATSDDYVGT